MKCINYTDMHKIITHSKFFKTRFFNFFQLQNSCHVKTTCLGPFPAKFKIFDIFTKFDRSIFWKTVILKLCQRYNTLFRETENQRNRFKNMLEFLYFMKFYQKIFFFSKFFFSRGQRSKNRKFENCLEMVPNMLF